MIEQMTDMPPGTIGIRASGEITTTELHDVLRPILIEAGKAGPLRMLHLLEDGFEMTPSALRRDAVSGLTSASTMTGTAFRSSPTSSGGAHAIHLVELFVPGELRLFKAVELDAAKTWVAQPSPTEASKRLL